jgi:ComF family protein
VDVIFPPLCYICESYLQADQKIICQNCWLKIPEFNGQLDQSLSKRTFDRLFILFEFEDTIRQLIHLLKYKRHLTLASYFGIEASIRFDFCHHNPYDEIIPVPLHPTRRRERGYNQSEEIALALARIINIPVKSEHLMRIRLTSTQTRMTREERDMNVMGAFKCTANLSQKNILLIDDVITTGSTVEACLKVLKDAGAKKIDVLVIAHPLEMN